VPVRPPARHAASPPPPRTFQERAGCGCRAGVTARGPWWPRGHWLWCRKEHPGRTAGVMDAAVTSRELLLLLLLTLLTPAAASRGSNTPLPCSRCAARPCLLHGVPASTRQRKCTENYNKRHSKAEIYLQNAVSVSVISNYSSFRVLFDKIATAYFIRKIYL